jgi:L-lactate dehydrogenase (cytochrome)
LSAFIAEQFDQSLSWDDIEWFRTHWKGHIILKGVQSVADATEAVAHGIDAIAVSNHGGRQLDRSPSPISLIAPIANAISGAVPIICDGGIRRGADIVTALSLGASACTMGRSYLYGLGAAGEQGVERAYDMLVDEMRRTMALTGVCTIAEIDSTLTTHHLRS